MYKPDFQWVQVLQFGLRGEYIQKEAFVVLKELHIPNGYVRKNENMTWKQ